MLDIVIFFLLYQSKLGRQVLFRRRLLDFFVEISINSALKLVLKFFVAFFLLFILMIVKALIQGPVWLVFDNQWPGVCCLKLVALHILLT